MNSNSIENLSLEVTKVSSEFIFFPGEVFSRSDDLTILKGKNHFTFQCVIMH